MQSIGKGMQTFRITGFHHGLHGLGWRMNEFIR